MTKRLENYDSLRKRPKPDTRAQLGFHNPTQSKDDKK